MPSKDEKCEKKALFHVIFFARLFPAFSFRQLGKWATQFCKANDDDAGEKGDEEDDRGEEFEAPQPRNKSELYRMFNQKGPTMMVCGFMEDYQLKAVAKIILEVAWPLENSFYKTLATLAEGWNAQCACVADRALGSYLGTVVAILLAIEAQSFHDWLEMTPSLRSDQGLPDDAEIPRWATNEMKLLDVACTFSATLAEHVLWSHLQYWFAIPQVIAGILHKDPEKRELALSQALRLAKVIVKAEGVQRPSALLRDLLQDLGWQKQQTPRECMALLLQNDRSELKALAKRLYTGTPSTKDILENTFAFLHRKAALHVNSKMADATKYAYNIVSPYPETGGCPQILPDKTDYMSIQSPSGVGCCQGLGTQASLLSAEDPFSMSRSSSPTSADHAKQVSIGWAVEPTEVHSSSCLFAGG